MITENGKNKKTTTKIKLLYVREIEEILEMEIQRKNNHGAAATLVFGLKLAMK